MFRDIRSWGNSAYGLGPADLGINIAFHFLRLLYQGAENTSETHIENHVEMPGLLFPSPYWAGVSHLGYHEERTKIFFFIFKSRMIGCE